MSEEVLYEDAASGWRITTGLARFGDITYAIGQINSVGRQRVEANKSGPHFTMLVGIAFFVGMVYVGVPMIRQPQYSTAALVCPAFIGFIGLTFVMIARDALRKAKPTFMLRLHTSATEKQLVICKSEEQMVAIESAILTALAQR